MKKFLATAALLAAGIGVNAVATATAAASTQTKGTVVGFKYDATTKVGKLTIKRSSGKQVYRVTSATDCGYSTGQSGDQIRCKSLGKPKYGNKPVRITWTRGEGTTRIAELVAVDLS
jgi:hypothetical protein